MNWENIQRPSVRIGLAVCVAALAAGYGLGQAKQAKRKVIYAQEIRLTDRQGKTRVLVSVSPTNDTPSFKLLDARGDSRVNVSLDVLGRVHVSGLPLTLAPAPLKAPTAPATPAAAPTPSPTFDPKDVIQTTVPASLQFKVKMVNGTAEEHRFGNSRCRIECEVRSTKTVAKLIVKANFYDDKGNYVDEDVAFLGSLPVAEVWRFNLQSTTNSASVGKIVQIKAE